MQSGLSTDELAGSSSSKATPQLQRRRDRRCRRAAALPNRFGVSFNFRLLAVPGRRSSFEMKARKQQRSASMCLRRPRRRVVSELGRRLTDRQTDRQTVCSSYAVKRPCGRWYRGSSASVVNVVQCVMGSLLSSELRRASPRTAEGHGCRQHYHDGEV